MNLYEIKTFLAVIETGKLNAAAQLLHVTQSTVTARLSSLEAEIGQTLFHRRKSGAELTSAGFRFERYAQLMVDVWRQARQETALPSSIDSIFNLGCHPDLWPGYGEKMISHLHRTYNSTALSTWSGEQPDLDRWLGSGLIDAAICYSPVLRTTCTESRLKTEKLVLVSTTPRKLMRWDPKYIYVDGGEGFRRNHAAAYPDGDTPLVTIGSAIWARAFLLDNQGSGYLPLGLIQNDVDQGKFHPVPHAPVFERNTYLVMNNDAATKWPWLNEVVAMLSV